MKRIFTLLFTIFTLFTLQAQEVTSLRVGYVNREAILQQMPQTSELKAQIKTQRELFEKEYEIMQNEYNLKVKSYIENNKGMSEPIKLARQAEITEYEERLALYTKRYRKVLDEKYERGMSAINAQLSAAISTVAQREGCNIVFDKETPLYVDSNCVDLTKGVEQELGI